MTARSQTHTALGKWAPPAVAIVAVCGLCALRLNIDWPVVSITALAAAASGLGVEVLGKSRVRLALIHPVLFGCAITLGPSGALIPATAAGTLRVFSLRRSDAPLCRLLYDLLGPAAATSAAGLVFTALGGDLSWPHGADSAAPLVWAALAYATASALLFGAVRKAGVNVADEPVGAGPVAVGWLLSVLSGYFLAVIYSAAPVYAVYAAAAAALCTAWTLAQTPRARIEAGQKSEPIPYADHVQDEPLYVDSVTGLANRRYLDLFLDRELGRAERLRKPLSVAVFNIDGFKSLDEEARKQGILELGECLAAGIREYDIAARHSDGRLVLVLPETSTEIALDVVDRLRRTASAVLGQSLSVSVGLASFPEHGINADEIINAAHYALNRGRSQESDRVHIPENLARAS